MPVFMGPSPLLAWSQVWFKKNQETSCWLRQLCLPSWPLPDAHRDFAWISWNGLSHSSHAVHSPSQMCVWKSFITLCALVFSHFIFLFGGRSTGRTKGLVTFRFTLISSLGSHVWKKLRWLGLIGCQSIGKWEWYWGWGMDEWKEEWGRQRAEVITGCSAHKLSLISISSWLHPKCLSFSLFSWCFSIRRLGMQHGLWNKFNRVLELRAFYSTFIRCILQTKLNNELRQVANIKTNMRLSVMLELRSFPLL